MNTSITNRGVTIIELLLVILIVASIGITIAPVSSNFIVKSYFRDSKNYLISQLYTAKINSMTNKENSSWGINTTAHQITLFKGTSFATRDTAFDKSFNTSKNITVSSNEIIFTQHTANLDSDASFTINTDLGESYTINLNQVGTIDVN